MEKVTMKNAKIDTIGQLISKTKKDLMNTKKFGRKCLNEIVKTLDDMGLSLRS